MSNKNSQRKILCVNCKEWCGTGRKYCKKCREEKKINEEKELLNKLSKMKKKDCCYEKGHISNKYAYIRWHAQRTHKENFQSCQNCGYKKHVELCHIKPIKEWSENSLLIEINSDKNIIGLCPNCHWEFDNGILKL